MRQSTRPKKRPAPRLTTSWPRPKAGSLPTTARARKQLEGELAGLVADATEAVIDEKIDAKKDAQLIERALKGKEKQAA